jgi:hypothetical protein
MTRFEIPCKHGCADCWRGWRRLVAPRLVDGKMSGVRGGVRTRGTTEDVVTPVLERTSPRGTATRSGRPRFLAGGAFHSACGSRQFEEAGVDAAEDQRAALEVRRYTSIRSLMHLYEEPFRLCDHAG